MKKLLIAFLALLCLGAVGPRPARIVLIKFADHDESPCDPAYATDVVFNQYAPWLAQESHNKEWIVPSGVYGPFTLAHDIAYYQCPIGTGGYYSFSGCIGLFDEAAGLVQPYFDPYSDLTIFLYNGPIVGAVTGSPDIHTICYSPPEAEYAHLTLHIMKHEGGHAQPERLFHAGSLTCPGGEDAPLHYDDPNADGCFVQGYGDPWDPMGSGDEHYSMWMRSRLGWEQASNSKVITRTQTISLADSFIDTSVVQEARIPLSFDGRYLYSVEYRASVGVLIRLIMPQPYYYGVETMLLNSDYASFAVTSANPFIDSYRGIRVDLLDSDPLQATILITIKSHHGGAVAPRGRSPRVR